MWDPDQYLTFASFRRRPVLDLLSRVPQTAIHHVVDLGCGPGQLTELLRARWPEATITAVDRDRAMIDRARSEHAGPGVTYVRDDIDTWEPYQPVDLVFSNAALHWLPHHLELLDRFSGWLRPGGVLAMQVPGNTGAPSHRMVAEQRGRARWRELVGQGADDHLAVADPSTYARRLASLGLSTDVWETTYTHVLEGDDPVVAWLSGSTLRPVLAALDDADTEQFVTELAERLRPHYPPDDGGRTYLSFRRIFAVGRR